MAILNGAVGVDHYGRLGVDLDDVIARRIEGTLVRCNEADWPAGFGLFSHADLHS